MAVVFSRVGREVINMSKKKKDSEVLLSFLGGSAESVTGSMNLIEIKQKDGSYKGILLECGSIQTTSNVLGKDLSANRKMLDKLPKEIVGNIDYVLLSHAHCDHIGNLSYLNKENGFQGKIFGSYKTIEIGKKLIEDSVNIHEKTIQKLKANGKKTRPLYSKSQMFEVFGNMESLPMEKTIDLDDRVSVKLLYNNHCYGSVMIQLWIKKLNGQKFSLIYTGDMGSKYNETINPFNDKRQTIPKCNYLISEGTYNDITKTLNKQIVKDELKRFKETIKDALLNNKRVLISSFSFNKGQYLPCLIYELFKDEEWFNFDMVIDGVLIHKCTETYLKTLDGEMKNYLNNMLNWSHTKLIKTQDSTNAFLSKKEPSIVISTSGFLTQGRIVNYLKQYLGSSKCCCVFTGYFGDSNSIGGKICNSEQKTVTIEKQVILKRCDIHTFGNAFSGHIQSNELISELKGVKCDKLLIHHSEGDSKYELADTIRSEARRCNNTMIVIPVDKNNNQFVL
jgi:metallo-beta-lactamase family protein